MKKSLLLFASLTLAAPLAANAQVDPKIHKMCLQAADYQGCVNAQSGNSGQKRMTIDKGLALAEGNQCPDMMAYVGGGTCRSFYCVVSSGGHDQTLAGKDWSCKGGGLFRSPVMRLGNTTARASYNKKCPPARLFEPGWENTCRNWTIGFSGNIDFENNNTLRKPKGYTWNRSKYRKSGGKIGDQIVSFNGILLTKETYKRYEELWVEDPRMKFKIIRDGELMDIVIK